MNKSFGKGLLYLFLTEKNIRIMKHTCFMLILFVFHSAASSSAQNTKIDLNINQSTLKQVFKEIESKTDYTFFYNDEMINIDRIVDIQVKRETVENILNKVLTDCSFVIENNTILLIPKDPDSVPTVAQQAKRQISGTVIDERGEPIIGANVIERGTTNGVVTDIDGKFSLSVADNSVLQISYIGSITQEVAIGNKSAFNITLLEDTQKLEEVVVVGYGSVSKRELTSAVSSVKSEDFIQGAFNNPLSMIDGKVSGVNQSNTAAADPNSNPNLQIRGASSLESGNDPLIIIDGMPGANIRNIASQDIESITVLKDGSAAAIYGSRAANGVILIETKKGKSGKVSISYDGYLDHDFVANKPEVLSAEEFIKHERDKDFGYRNNWYDELLNKKNIGHSHYIAISGGGENLTFRASANYKTKEGLDIASFRKEYGVRMGFSSKTLNNLLEISGNLSTRIIKEEYADHAVFHQAIKLNPTQPMMEPSDPGRYSILYGHDTYNPVGMLKDRENGGDKTFSLADFKIKLNLLPVLNTEVSLARQSQEYLRRIYYNSNHKESFDNARNGRANLREENWTDYTFEWIGNYFATFDKHTLKLMGGYSYQEFNHRAFEAENANFPSDMLSYNNLSAGDWMKAAGRLGMSSEKDKEKTIGFPARLTYNYDDTYFLTASVRYEGNSKFGANHKWGWFPSASAAWRFSTLPVFNDIDFVDDLKFRASYGVTGRSGFARYSALSRYGGTSSWQDETGQWIQAWGPANNPNPNLHWEKQISYNLGIDFALLKNQLSGSLDAYIRKGKDVISNYDAPLPPFLYDQIFTNVASTSSKGLELNLSWNVVNSKNFSYSTTVVASYTKTKLDEFSNEIYQKGFMDKYYLPAPGNPGYAQRLKDGTEIGTFWGFRYAGVDENGNMLVWKNAKPGTEKILASGEASDVDKGEIGHGAPRYSFSWSNSLKYKGFDLSMYFQGRFDYQILNMYQMYHGLVAEPGINLLKDAYEKNGHIKSGKVMCDYFLENGNYFTLDNITLGWTPKINSKWISNLRIYGTMRNVFTLTKYSVMSPTSVETNGLNPGVSGLNVYPASRSVSFGIQLSY